MKHNNAFRSQEYDDQESVPTKVVRGIIWFRDKHLAGNTKNKWFMDPATKMTFAGTSVQGLNLYTIKGRAPGGVFTTRGLEKRKKPKNIESEAKK